MKALVIIDFQRALSFPDGTEPPAHRLEATRDILARARESARAAGAAVIFIRHDHVDPESMWAPGRPGHAFFPELAPEGDDLVVVKTSCDAFRETSFAEVLSGKGIDTLLIGGYASEYCVDTTIRAAASRGYRTIALSDAHTTRNRAHMDAEPIIAHHNLTWAGFVNPGNPIRVLPVAEAFG